MFISSNKDSGSQNWTDYVVVLPTVSVGNVGQLACDVLISTLCLKHAGYIYVDCVLPVVGNNPFDSDSKQITTALDVYESPEHKLVIVQQRAPVMKGRKSQFVDHIFEWIRSSNFKQIIILTSVFAHERKDAQLVGPQTRYIATPEALKLFPDAVNQAWIPLEQRRSSDDFNSSEEYELVIPGSGVTKSLYNKCLSANLKALVLLIFCAEGDNIGEALTLSSFCNSFNRWIASDHQLKIPPSWQQLFGNRFEQTLF